jgi:hypothetical protein
MGALQRGNLDNELPDGRQSGPNDSPEVTTR